MRYIRRLRQRSGAVLLVVLFIVMAVVVLSLGYTVRADRELSSGQNLILHTRIDHLAQGGLVYGRAMALNWPAASFPAYTSQQLETGSNDYYDLTIGAYSNNGTTPVTYTRTLTCTAYRRIGTTRVAQTALQAKLHYDPAAKTGFFKSIKRI